LSKIVNVFVHNNNNNNIFFERDNYDFKRLIRYLKTT